MKVADSVRLEDTAPPFTFHYWYTLLLLARAADRRASAAQLVAFGEHNGSKSKHGSTSTGVQELPVHDRDDPSFQTGFKKSKALQKNKIK